MRSKLLDKKFFHLLINEKVVLSAILLNTIALFTISCVQEGTTLSRIAYGVDYFCVIYFIIEAIIKLVAHGRDYFKSNWNIFDFVIVILSLPVLISPWVELHQFAAVLLLRLGRLFRLFQLFHFIPNVDRMVTGVKRSVNACVGVVIALDIILFILALGANMIFGHLSPEHFGNPFISLYSIFRVFTIEGWYEMPDAIAMAPGSTPFWGVVARLYFVFCVLGGGIIGMSLVNAIFVDEMTMDNNDELSEKVDRLQAQLDEMQGLLKQMAEKDRK